MSQKQKKILVNGCSHSRAFIPDNESADPWPVLFTKRTGDQLVNLALDGKANQQIVEETIRYLINFNDIDHVVIQLNEWKRLNFFRRDYTFEWEAKDIYSQIPNLVDKQQRGITHFVKIPAVDNNDLRITRGHGTSFKQDYLIGDMSHTHSIITIGTLVNCLSSLCQQRNIGLTIVNFHALNECRGDPVWNTIPEEFFLIHNRTCGLYNHMLWMFETPDTFHFEYAGQQYLADVVYDHYTSGQQLIVEKKSFDDTERVFDYR